MQWRGVLRIGAAARALSASAAAAAAAAAAPQRLWGCGLQSAAAVCAVRRSLCSAARSVTGQALLVGRESRVGLALLSDARAGRSAAAASATAAPTARAGAAVDKDDGPAEELDDSFREIESRLLSKVERFSKQGRLPLPGQSGKDRVSDEEFLDSLEELANLYYSYNIFPSSETVYRDLLKWQESFLGAAAPETGITVNNLAHVLALQDKFEEAIKLQKDAIALLQQHTEGDDSMLAPMFVNLGDMEKAADLMEDAVKSLSKGRELMRQRGKTEAEMASLTASLADAMRQCEQSTQALAEVDAALPHLRQAVRDATAAAGATSPAAEAGEERRLETAQELVEALKTKALLLFEAGDEKSALGLLNEAKAFRLQGRASSHEPPDLLDIAEALVEMRSSDEALAVLRQIDQESFHPNFIASSPEEFADTVASVAALYRLVDEEKLALTLLQRAVGHLESPMSVGGAVLLPSLAATHLSLGNVADATASLAVGEEAVREFFGPESEQGQFVEVLREALGRQAETARSVPAAASNVSPSSAAASAEPAAAAKSQRKKKTK